MLTNEEKLQAILDTKKLSNEAAQMGKLAATFFQKDWQKDEDFNRFIAENRAKILQFGLGDLFISSWNFGNAQEIFDKETINSVKNLLRSL